MDQISFYYTATDYEFFLKFFDLLEGNTRFSYEEYFNVHEKLLNLIRTTDKPIPRFMDTANDFLQFLYEINVICYVEDVENHKPFIHRSFRDRSWKFYAKSEGGR